MDSRYDQTGGIDARAPPGRRVSLSTAARRRAVQLLISGEVGGAKFIARKLKSEGHSDWLVSASTVLRGARQQAELDGDPLVCLRGRPRKGLTQRTKNQRLQFAKANIHRNWRHTMITDRCKFHFRFPGTAFKMTRWCTKATREQDAAFTPNKPSVLNVYAGITAYGVTKMHPVTGTTGMKTPFKNDKGGDSKNITKQEYKQVVAKTLLPEGRRIFSAKGLGEWTLQQDGDPSHGVARPAITKFNTEGRGRVDLLDDWPGNSPDLSPIENVWGWVDAQVAAKGCKTFQEFKAEVHKTFKKIPLKMLENLMDSIPRRLARVVETEGGKCGY